MSVHAQAQAPSSSRRCACGGKIGSDGHCDRCRRSLQMSRAPSASSLPRAPAIVHDVLASAGKPLPQSAQRLGAGRLGHDFSSVRIHTDSRAHSSARAMGANAYTVGNHVVFGPGRWAPESKAGASLLLHELTHVVQQGAQPPLAGSPLAIAPAGDAYEREAERAASGARDLSISRARHRVQRQLVTPLAPEGGFGGLTERDRQRASGHPEGSVAPSVGLLASLFPHQVCARPLQSVLGRLFNHAYIEAPPYRYAVISPLCPANWYDNPVTGTTAQKWDNSPDPCGKSPICLPCFPKPGVTDLGKCLRSAFSAYNSLSLYRASRGPNSNTFAGTLARACCAGMASKPPALGSCPGWDKPPAPARAGGTPCPPGPTC